ncbi:decaprenyl-phosphate phosphoribosyltransferase [Mumia sp. zg.B17]|uniref:decaprenyl-phosphate phosphoribosyltransferase n=1 Tax=unclassified Mumia TaxID=2621872 RepID=UPI001C6DDDCE|nr:MULTISPECIES: decaprenyl-phosphate phosphoribosyltransferase [unclassified Mumia]MBW9206182.1 decaprenyl-phosphate phosphoribosyltransferase [Mumia sp. zg.B17]MBW9211524.1 decaprenyl-phosphate phosphoribosyltransferase [Mumia sp. zg.B21]
MSTTTPRRSQVASLLATTRPRQWLKNVIVVTAPLAAGILAQPDVLGRVAVALVAFIMVSAAVYLINDVCDAEEDRRHPVKSARPVAAGEVTPAAALGLAVVLTIVGVGIGSWLTWELGLTLAVYVTLQVSYALWLKHMAVIDLAVVASGFLLRAVGGGVATGVALSQWFLLVAAFGSLFMVAGKRYSEFHALGSQAGTRRSLTLYSESYLRFVWGLAASVTITAYCLWAFEIAPESGIPWQTISIAPFVLGLLRYAVDIDRGLAGEPEDIVLRDRVLQSIGVVWLITFALGVLG